MAYKSIFEEGEIKPATTPKASTGYVSIFDDEEKKLEPITTQSVPVKISPLVPEQKKHKRYRLFIQRIISKNYYNRNS